MIRYQVEFFAQGSEIALLCQRREGISQLSWKTKNYKSNHDHFSSIMKRKGRIHKIIQTYPIDEVIQIKKEAFFTCSFVIDQFAHFALHNSQCLSRLLFHQQPQLPQVGKCEQVVHSIALMKSNRDNITIL